MSLKLYRVTIRLRMVFWAIGSCKPYTVKLVLSNVANIIPSSVWTVTDCTSKAPGILSFSTVCSDVSFGTATASGRGDSLGL